MKGNTFGGICGIDEAGRGPTAGPVCAAAGVLDPGFDRDCLKDSKVLTPRRREHIASALRSSGSLIGTGWAWPEEIDEMNIHHATLLAMKRAFLDIAVGNPPAGPGISSVTRILVDGKFTPEISIPSEAVIHGDSLIPEISAASIIAKVTRDRWMIRYSWIEPSWEFDRHKGYPTPRHRELCRLHGLSPIHRRSFRIFS